MASRMTLWHKWRSLKLPWRRKWLVGQDLAGNTFWEFVNPLPPFRPRRIVQYPRGTAYGDVNIPPVWMQWLRHTRDEAPSIMDQQIEVQRQQNIKVLAQRADERWREQESYLDKPRDDGESLSLPSQPPHVNVEEAEEATGAMGEVQEQTRAQEPAQAKHTDNGRGNYPSSQKERKDERNPWKAHDTGPSEGWQPQSWSPRGTSRP